jgi:hypothetical protein
MNSGVRLVQAYLHLNGYFTISELPVIRELRGGGYAEVTDLDLLAVRFPRAEYVVARGRPGPPDDLHLEGDERLLDLPGHVDVLIAEVKEGKARVNDALRRSEALSTALRRVGCVPDTLMAWAVGEIQARGEVRLDVEEAGLPTRVRLVAFGDGQDGPRGGYHVFSLRHVAHFVERHLDRYHDVLTPADLGDTTLGLLHLLRKLD